MKKILLLLVLLFGLNQSANAITAETIALDKFDINNPPATFAVKLKNTVDKVAPKDTVIETDIHKVKESKRLKIRAGLILKVTKVTLPDGRVLEPKNVYAKYTVPIDKIDATKEVAVCATDLFVNGFYVPYHAVEGAIKNKEGNRTKSALKGAYDSSVLSYVEKGEDISIKEGDTVFFDFYTIDTNDKNVINKIKYRK